MARPAQGDYLAYFDRYISLTQGNDLREVMENHSRQLAEFYSSLPEVKADFSYAPGKWTLREVLQHVIDTERIFVYRALRFARRDVTPLASFDENAFARNAMAGKRSLESLKQEFTATRYSSDLMLLSFGEEQLSQAGIAGNHVMTANAAAFIIYGHLLHHQNILEVNYL